MSKRKITTEEFISRSKKVHGDEYCYDKTIYISSSEKLTITCKKHGDFKTVPSSHMRGHICLSCSIESASARKIIGTDAFISRARDIHGDRYSYEDSNYISADDKITINCRLHGDFQQRAAGHLSGKGCRQCAIEEKALTLSIAEDDFILRSVIAHDNKYDYSESFPLVRKKAKIICEHHGPFMQTVLAHIRGQGCPGCAADKSRKTKDDFILEAMAVHGNKYDYGMVNYKTYSKSVEIKCQEHGVFRQAPGRHLSGQGCPGCARTGFDKTKDGFVYFLSGDGLIKVGISNNPKKRLKQLKCDTPFEFSLIGMIKMSGEDAAIMEKRYHKKYSSAGLHGFGGSTEWLIYSKELMAEIINENTKI